MLDKFAEINITKEVVEKSKESVIDKKPENGIDTYSTKEQVDTKVAAPNKLHKANVAENKVPTTNKVTNTTTIKSKPDPNKVRVTGYLNEVELSKTKVPAMVETDNSTEEITVKPKEKKDNEKTITANITIDSDPNLLTCESVKHLLSGEVIATFPNTKVSTEELNTLRTDGKSLIADKDLFKEPNPSSSHEQAEQTHPKDPITAKYSPKRITNLEIVEKIKPTRRKLAPYDRKTSDHTIPEGWKSKELDEKTKTTFLASPDKSQILYSKTALHNKSDTEADSQEVSQRKDELKDEALKPNDDIHPTRRHEEVPSSNTQIQIEEGNLPESPLPANENINSTSGSSPPNNENIQIFANKVKKTWSTISGWQKGKHIPNGWKPTQDGNTSGNISFPTPNGTQFNNKNNQQYALKQEGWENSQDLPHGWMTKNTKRRTKVLPPTKDVPPILKIATEPDAANSTQSEPIAVDHNDKPNRKKKRHKKLTSPSKNNKVESNNATTINPKNKIQQWVSIIILITGLPLINVKPVPGTQSPEEEEFLFQVNDCAGMTGNKLNIQTFNGGTPPSCKNAKIYEEPVQTPVQIMVLPDKHPVQFVNCKVHIKAISGMCDIIKIINGRNVNLLSKVVYDGYYAPHPEECFKANRTGSITFQLPVIGSYPGEEITQKLASNKISGTVYPYGEPGKINCLGATWIDPNQNIQRSATLEIQYVIQIENVWGYYHLQSGKMMVNGVSFPISSANTFQREKPQPKQVQIQYKNSVLLDQDRQALFVQVGEH